MSTALVRQALEFVDQDENTVKKNNNKKRLTKGNSSTQGDKSKFKSKSKVQKKEQKPQKDIAEENIKKLLALSKPAVDKNIAKQIIERARKGKPLVDKIKVKKDIEKSILFPDD